MNDRNAKGLIAPPIRYNHGKKNFVPGPEPVRFSTFGAGLYMPAAMTPQIQRGRFLVVVAIIDIFFVSAVSDIWSAHFSLVNWLLTVALFYALWRGQRWARWLFVGLMGLTPLGGYWFLRGSPPPLLIGLFIQDVLVAALLASPPSVSVFLAYQRSRPVTSISSQQSHQPQEDGDPY